MLPNRLTNRLEGFDYSSDGAYFITVCVKNKKELLGRPQAQNTADTVGAAIGRPLAMELSSYGKIVDTSIQKISDVYQTVTVEKYVVMPNHIHMLLLITVEPDNSGRAMRAPTISTVINQFKGIVSKQIGFSIWQKSFYDHIIRSETDYLRIWQYIDENPAKWKEDRYFP